MTRLPLVDLDQLCHLIHSHHAEKQRAMVKTKIALLSVRSIVDNCLEAHEWFLWGFTWHWPISLRAGSDQKKGGRHQNSESLGKNRLYELYV